VLISRGRCSLIGLLVVMSVVVVLVLLLFSFPVDGMGVGSVPVHLFFVVSYCFLFWIGCVLSKSVIMTEHKRSDFIIAELDKTQPIQNRKQ